MNPEIMTLAKQFHIGIVARQVYAAARFEQRRISS